MKLYSLLNENHVLIGESAGSLDGAFRRLLKTFSDVISEERVDRLTAELLERERQQPTTLIDGVCLPHARLEWLDRFLLGVMVPAVPVPSPVAGQPAVQLIFMVLTPQKKNTMMLQTMAAVARLLKSKEVLKGLVRMKTAPRLIRLIEESGVDVKKTLIAADVMTPVTHQVGIDAYLAQAVDILVDAQDEGIPVLNDRGELVGELTSKELLQLGMPKYLDLLANPAMLESFEPFENYFQHENSMRVREVCRRETLAVEPTTPIVQVTHLMMTRQRRRIYVVEDGELKGVILRKNIVAKVLHY